MAFTLADFEIETLGNTLSDVEATAHVDTPANWLAETNFTTLGHTLFNVTLS